MLADGRFPSGGHAQSAGVESAIAHGDVIDVVTLERYLAGRVATTGFVDAAFACRACAAHLADDVQALVALDREYEARMPSPRARTVSRQLGRQLVRVAVRVWPDARSLPGNAHHAIAFGSVVAAAGGTPVDAVSLALHQLTSTVVTAAVRLLGLDPVSVVAVQAAQAPAVTAIKSQADRWAVAEPNALPASSSSLSEILAEHHATWSSRLFVA